MKKVKSTLFALALAFGAYLAMPESRLAADGPCPAGCCRGDTNCGNPVEWECEGDDFPCQDPEEGDCTGECVAVPY